MLLLVRQIDIAIFYSTWHDHNYSCRKSYCDIGASELETVVPSVGGIVLAGSRLSSKAPGRHFCEMTAPGRQI